MRFSFVILTWNRCRFLEQCLNSLFRSIADLQGSEIIVLDNGSDDGTHNILGAFGEAKSLRLISRVRNNGLNAYKRLFGAASGDYIVDVDDDVLEFPAGIDQILAEYMKTFQDYGFIALNVVQNELTNGARPALEEYIEETRNGKTILRGPTGGWCACFRRSEFKKIQKDFLSADLHMGYGEDTFLTANFEQRLSLKSGIIRDVYCLHASGPEYAKRYGHLDREIEKYANSNLDTFVEDYQKYRDAGKENASQS